MKNCILSCLRMPCRLPGFFSVVFLVAALAVFGGATPPLHAAEARIGLMAPLTGKWASEGEDARRVLQLLADMWNASGKLGDTRLILDIQDDAGDPRTGALAAQKLLSSGVRAVVSAYGSSVTEAAQQLLDEGGAVHMSSGATAVRLTEKQLPRFFRIGPRDDGQSRVAARFIAREGYRAVAIVHDNSAHPQGFAEEARARLRELGVPVVFYDALTPGQRDYSVILSKLRTARPDIVLYTGYYPETGLLLRQKAEMQWNVPMLGGDASNHQDLVKIAGKTAARGYRFCSAAMPQDLDTPEARKFLEAYTARYGAPPLSVWSVLAGDGFNVLAAAVAAGAVAPADMAAWLHALREYTGITGNVAFDDKGDRRGDLYHIYEVDEEGLFRPLRDAARP